MYEKITNEYKNRDEIYAVLNSDAATSSMEKTIDDVYYRQIILNNKQYYIDKSHTFDIQNYKLKKNGIHL